MRVKNRTWARSLAGSLVLAITWGSICFGQPAAKPLTEQDVITLVGVGLEEPVILNRIERSGLAFALDSATLERLLKAGASPAVLAGLKKAVEKKPAAAGPTILFEQVVQLLELGIDSPAIIKRLEASPTIFTLDDNQLAVLREKGASEALIASMRQQRAAPATAAKEVSDLVLILDCSNSMREPTVDGITKMDLAKSTVIGIIRKLPPGLHLALIVYGHDESLGCNAVKLVRPLGELDAAGKEQLVSYIQTLQPAGHTPIANALTAAGVELAKTTANSGVVLVTDGIESCHGDPVAAANLLAQNPRLTFGINVIGLGLKPEEQTAVKQLAARGKFYDAQKAGDFAKAFDSVLASVVAPAPKLTAGLQSAVKPSKDADSPALLEMEKYAVGRLGAKASHYFAVDVPKAGKYTVIADARRSDDVTGNLWVAVKVDNDTIMDELVRDRESRFGGTIELQPGRHVVSITNNWDAITDYRVAVYAIDTKIPFPRLDAEIVPAPIVLGKPQSFKLVGKSLDTADAYYRIALPTGDYIIDLEYERSAGATGAHWVSACELSPLGIAGTELGGSYVQTPGRQTTTKKLILADDRDMIIRVRAQVTSLIEGRLTIKSAAAAEVK